MARWLPDSFDPDAHNARVRSQRSAMRGGEQEQVVHSRWQSASEVVSATVSPAAAIAPPTRRGARASCLAFGTAATAPRSGRASGPTPTATPRATLHPFQRLCASAGLPVPVAEHRFHDSRRWRFDFAWPTQFLAVEIDGAIWTQGRHSRGSGILGDMAKLNAAALAGWRVLRYTPQQMGEAIRDLRIALQ